MPAAAQKNCSWSNHKAARPVAFPKKCGSFSVSSNQTMIQFTRRFQLAILAATLTAIPVLAAPPEHGPDTELAREMKNISKNVKALKPILGDPSKKNEALADIAQMIRSAEKARTFTPKKAAEIPEARRGQFNKDFQQEIDGLIAQFKKIQAAIQDGRGAEAEAEFGKISGIKRKGHEQFAAD
jgi:soluble cytochrome b562